MGEGGEFRENVPIEVDESLVMSEDNDRESEEGAIGDRESEEGAIGDRVRTEEQMDALLELLESGDHSPVYILRLGWSAGLNGEERSSRLGRLLCGSIGKTLKALHMQVSGLTGSSASKVLAPLSSASSVCLLQELYISHNDLGDEGAQSLAAFLESSTSIRRLSMQAIRLGVSGARRLAMALASNQSLEELVIGSEEEGPTPILLEAFVPRRQPEDESSSRNRSVAQLTVFLTDEAHVGEMVAHILLGNDSISRLILECCDIPTDEWLQIFKALQKNSTLKILEMVRCNVPNDEVLFEALADAVQAHPCLQDIDMHETPWVNWEDHEAGKDQVIRRLIQTRRSHDENGST